MRATRTLFALILAVFLAFGTAGVAAAFAQSASASSHDMHQLCPLMGVTPVCANILESIGHWQSLMTPSLSLLALAVVLPALLLIILFPRARAPVRARSYPAHLTLYEELFARGILNPKAP